MAEIEELAGIEAVAERIRGAQSIVILTGAGISTESGIPDFRGPNGVWTKNPGAEKTATLQHYLANRDARVNSWKNRIGSSMWQSEPNSGHRAIADFAEKAKVDLLVTQNIDGLHQKAGFPEAKMVEIHGTVHEFRCMSCTDRGPIERVLDRVRAGEEDPPCRSCGGILKSATISFGQNLVGKDLQRAQTAAAMCDLFIAAGTSLVVYPVAELPRTALERGAKLVIMTAEETPYDRHAETILRGQLGTVLPEIAARL